MKKVGKTAKPFRYDLNQIPYDYTVEVRNRFKGLDLIDRVPNELWNEVRDRIKTIPMEKKCKKAKWLSGEALQIAVKRREAKSKGEKERFKHLNAEFQRIARRDNKGSFSDQCKEIEENNRMGKTRDLFKKIRDTMGTFHAKMGLIKDRNGMDLTSLRPEGNAFPPSLPYTLKTECSGIQAPVSSTLKVWAALLLALEADTALEYRRASAAGVLRFKKR